MIHISLTHMVIMLEDIQEAHVQPEAFRANRKPMAYRRTKRNIHEGIMADIMKEIYKEIKK